MKKRRNRLLGYMLAAVTIFTFAFGYLTPKQEAVAATGFTTVQPVVVVTGDRIISGGVYSADNVVNEKSYTLDELKALDTSNYVYSAINTNPTKSIYRGEGVKLKSLLQASGFTAWDTTKVSVVEPGKNGYVISFDPAKTELTGNTDAKNSLHLGTSRYYFPGFTQDPPTEEGKQSVETIIAWARGGEQGHPETVPEDVYPIDDNELRVMTGQVTSTDVNNPLWNGDCPSFHVLTGGTLTETALTIGNTAYTRADLLMMERADSVYSYETSNGSATDYVRGIPMSVLLEEYDDNAIVTFDTADRYDVSSSGYTVKELIDNGYMLAYEVGKSAAARTGIYDTAKKDESQYGFLRLYGADDNGKPAKLVNKITVTDSSGEDYSKSPYKHITNGGQEGDGPYNLDAITGATLTVEGPGVKKSVPVSVRDLEGRNAGIKRADYSDQREGSTITRKYEGIDLYYILHNMKDGDNGISLTDNAKIVQIKNRNRRTIAEFTTDQIDAAHKTDTPILVAYGTSYIDGINPRPFVFNNGNGADRDLGNEDGCIKLVYNKSIFEEDPNPDYTTFGNMAYIYVAEAETPGYKHDKSPYDAADVKNYVLTVTGDKIGREVNYTVEQLEAMVDYGDDGKPDNSGMGYRDEYSMANSTYWFVNEYEGIQLWKLLLRSGLAQSFADDDETTVSSTTTDNYVATDVFTTKQVADPDTFGFYEKNPADLNDGTYEGNENIRKGDDVSTGDKLRTGYPVLVAYGVNGYPYVEKSSQEGYMSGLENDGGPLRVISGKKKYNHANGSNQAKLLDKIVVGGNTNHYSTHKYNPADPYPELANQELTIKVLNGADDDAPEIKRATYKVGDIEDLIYGGVLTRNQLMDAKIKTFYQLSKDGTPYSDLYEGIDLNFFLKEIVEIPGYKGTITFSNGTKSVALSLEEVLATNNGTNTETNMTGLSPLLAYGKNGSPMVADKYADGYVKDVTLAEGTDYQNKVTVKNDGGPLAVLFPHTDTDVSDASVTNVTEITINLSPDKYAHTAAPYDEYMNDTISITGEGVRNEQEFTLLELEGKQTLAFTGDYSILKSGEGQTASQTRYRGINLYSLLTSKAVGLKSNADKVIVKTTDNETVEFTLSEIRKTYMNSITGETGLPVILAYGTGKAGDPDKEDGKPLVPEKTDEGYEKAYGNSGGPIRLAVGQTDAADVNSGKNVKFVKSIEVTASDMTSWNHNSAEVYRQYRDETVDLIVLDKDGKELYKHTYTVGEIEDNTSLVEREEANVVQIFTWEGIRLWDWIKQEAGSISGINDPITVTVAAADGFSADLRAKFGVDGLEHGIKDGENYVPIILAYGVGGYPLVIGDKSHSNGEGYDAVAGNNGGPLRLITHNSQGTSLTYVKKITVTVGDASDESGLVRIFGATRYETSLKVADELKDRLGRDKFDTVILADGRNYPDALAGSYLSSQLGAPIILVNSQKKYVDAAQKYIKANLNAGGTIYMLGGSAAVPDKAVSGLSGYNAVRLGGKDRYETNIKILEEAGKKSKENGFVVCTGKDFADSLSVAGVGKPILLVKGNTLLDSQKKYLKALSGDKTFDIIGGTGAVSDKMKKELGSYGKTNRIGGSTRYETSVNVAKAFFKNPSAAVVAYGKNFPDGLCGGALANVLGGPLILTENSKTQSAVAYAGEAGIRSGAVLGGPKLISDKAARDIFHLDAGADIDQR